MKRLRIGIAGVGGQGKKHFLNCLRIKEIELVAIADRSKPMLSRAARFGVKTYLDYHEMIRKENLDAVIIALPNFLHEDCCILSSKAGCDILVEKPLARNMEEEKRIADHVNKTGIRLMMGMSHRFIKSCKKLKREIDAGNLGRIDFASALFFSGPFFLGRRVPGWMFDSNKTGGGALLDLGCHMIDLFLWFFGEIHSVNGHTESHLNLGYDDYSEVLMRFKNGVNALVVVSWRSRIPCYRIEVAGEYGRMVALSEKFGIFDMGLWKVLSSFVKESILHRMKGRPFLPLGDDIYYNELDYFVKCILNDEEPKPDMNDWLKVSEIIDLVYQQNLIKVQESEKSKVENIAN